MTTRNNKNQVATFVFEDEFLVRTIIRGGNPWFVAMDVCAALGLGDHKVAVRKLDGDEEYSIPLIDSKGRFQDTIIVSESGLYTLILRCRDATAPGSVAHRFRRWVTSDVLPSIRKTGRYEAPGWRSKRAWKSDSRIAWRMAQFAKAAHALEEVGVDVKSLDLDSLLEFARQVGAVSHR